MIKFPAFALILAAAAPSVAQAQSYPPYPYNLMYRNGTPYDRGYSAGYEGTTSSFNADSTKSDYGRGVSDGNFDFWADQRQKSREESERRQQTDLDAKTSK
jgi:hypothetical protein